MSIVVSGTTIPTTGDYIKVGGTNISKVVCNGTTVWEKVSDFYIWKNGSPYSAYQPYLYGTTFSKISLTRGTNNWYGYKATNISNGIDGGFQLPNISASGCTNVKIHAVPDFGPEGTRQGERSHYVLVYGVRSNGSLDPIFTSTDWNYYDYGMMLCEDTTFIVPLKGYSTIQIKFRLFTGVGGDGKDAAGTVGAYVDYIYLYK